MFLYDTSELVNNVIFLHEENLVFAASRDKVVRVYHLDTDGEPHVTFAHHIDNLKDVLQLDRDLVSSIGRDKQLFSWRPTSAQLVDRWEHTKFLWSIAKLDDSGVSLGDVDGTIIVLKHKSGFSFQVHRSVPNSHYDCVNGIQVHCNSILTCSDEKTAEIWNSTSFELFFTLHHANSVTSASLSEFFIIKVCGGEGSRDVFIYRNSHIYFLHKLLLMDRRWHNTVSI